MSFGWEDVAAKGHSHCLDRQEVYNRTTTIYRGAAVEPTIAVNPSDPSNIVTAWQQARISNGAALEIGISYTKDSGKTWHKSSVPLQICHGGINQRAGDSWLSFSANGKRVYLCAAVLNATQEPHTQNQFGIIVSISKDGGASWNKPRYLASSMEYLSDSTKQFANLDKSSISADPNDAKQAIAVWACFNPSSSSHGDAQGSYTRDGGKHWSAPQLIYDPFPDLTVHDLSNGIQNDNQASNNVVVILPKKNVNKKALNGDWLNFATRNYAKKDATDAEYINDTFPFKFTLTDIVAIRSKDQGNTWKPNAKIVIPAYVNNLTYTGGYHYDCEGNITGGIGTLMRNDQTVPSYNVNPENGYLYVAYQTSSFRKDQLSQIGLSTSRDGGRTWSKPAQVSQTPEKCANPQAFTPFVAITKQGLVGVLYFDFRQDDKSNSHQTKMDAWLAIYKEVKKPKGGSTDIGLDFVTEIRLSNKSFIAQNGPETSQGVMTEGDYQFLTVHDDDFYAIYTKSFKGPFAPPTTLFTDPIHNASVLLDDNLRTAPFISIVKNTKMGPHLFLTKRLN